MANKPLLIIPPQYSTFEEMFNSQEYKDFIHKHSFEIMCEKKTEAIENSIHEFPTPPISNIIIGKSETGSLLEKFIVENGGQKIM